MSNQQTITKRLVELAWPIIGLNMLQVLALAVDTAMIGRTPNSEVALTGMGYSGQLIFLLMVAMIGLTIGTVVFVSRAHGAEDDQQAEHVFHQSIQLTILLGLGIAVGGNIIAEPLLWLLGADQTTMPAALDYIRPLLLGTVFNYLNILFAASLRGVGNTKLAFVVSLVMNLLNGVLNYGLILGNYGLEPMGIQGAAIGTVIAQATSVLIMSVLLIRGFVPKLVLRFRREPIDKPLVRRLFTISWPAAADMLVLNASLLSIVGLLSRLDQASVGAHTIGVRIQALAFIPGISVGQAIGAMVGQSLGAGDSESPRRILKSGIGLNLAIMTTLGVTFVVFAHPIVVLFGVGRASPIHDYAVEWIQLLGLSMPILGMYMGYTGLFQGSGSTRITLRINFWTTFIAQIPMSYLLGITFGLGPWGVWFAFPAVFVLKLGWAHVMYRRDTWAVTGTM